jgi:glutamyl-tRNA reductase
MPILHVYGIDHSRATVELREQLTFSADEAREVLPLLLSEPGSAVGKGAVLETMLLSTCNRTEVYLVVEGEITGYPLEPLRRRRPEIQMMDDQYLRYHLQGQSAVSHLYAVAASLRSQVPGDTQIATQVTTASDIARSAGVFGPFLERLVAGALRSAKRVRRETGLMAGGGGTGSAVLQTLRRIVPEGSRANRPMSVLLLGAGDMATEVATHLLRSATWSGVTRRNGAACGGSGRSIHITGVWTRDRQKAVRFGEMFGIASLSLREANQALSTVDAVIGACRGRVALLSEATLLPILDARIYPLFVLDLGVPRNLDPGVAGRDGIDVFHLDQLHQQMRERNRQRGNALAQAEQIVEQESLRFDKWYGQLPVRPIRAEMYASVEMVLSKWRSSQPAAVRHLRGALHRSLDQAFGTLGRSADVAS